jgi:hypothetical protein
LTNISISNNSKERGEEGGERGYEREGRKSSVEGKANWPDKRRDN